MSSPSPRQRKRGKRDKLTASTVRIQVEKPDDRADPIVVSFAGGAPENPKESKFIWREWSPNIATSRVIEGKDDNGTCVYRATAQGMGYDDRRTKVCVGVYDKQSGTLTLHQAASKGTVFELQQHLPSYKETLEETVANRSLFQDFGSAKKRKVLKSQQANRVNVETLIGAGSTMVDSMLNPKDGAKMSASNRKAVELSRNADKDADGVHHDPTLAAVASAQEEARKQTLPTYNPKAKDPCDVYDAKEMAGEEGWGRLCRVVDACLHKDDFYEALTAGKNKDADQKAEPAEKRGWAPSVMVCIRKLSLRAEEAASEEIDPNDPRSIRYQMRCALFLHHLIKFHRLFNSTRRVPGLKDGQNVWFGTPKELATHLLSTFAFQDEQKMKGGSFAEFNAKRTEEHDTPQYVMSPANKDKLTIEILLVYIMARGGKKMRVEDLAPIVNDLKGVDLKKAHNMLRMAGLTVTYVASTKKTRAELKVPLTFPQPSIRRGRR